MKKIRLKKPLALTVLLALCAVGVLSSCGSKKETVDSGATAYTASTDETTTVLTYDEDGTLVDVMEFSEETEATTMASEDLESDAEKTEIVTETVTDENGEAVTDADGNSETVTVIVSENSTEAEEPEGTVTSEEDENNSEETSVSATAATSNSGGTATTATKAATSSGYTYKSLNQTMYAKSSVNVRSTPNSSGTKLGTLTAGQSVTVTGQCNETSWYRISYNGATGYVSNNYLTSTKPSAETTTTKKTEATTTTKKAETATTEASTTAAATTTRTYATEEEKLAIIEGINNYRASQGYTEMPVVLNTFLTEQAQEWADYLAANDICESSMDDEGNDKRTGEWVVWNREYYGIVKLLGRDLSYWVSRGEDVGKDGFYECPFVGVGVAMNSAGKTILVVQGVRQIVVYDTEGNRVFNEIGAGIDYEWFVENSDGTVEWYTENSDFVALAYKIYDTGHFADFIPDLYYDLTYGNDYYKHIPSWMKGSSSWLS